MSKKKTENKQKVIRVSTPKGATSCIRCGTCCKKGGPSLHREDKKILLAGHIERESLITIRKGELAFFPFSERPEPIEKELVKIAGKGKGWVCCFYDEKESSCTIYAHRPLECRLLKCWDTAQLLSVIGKDPLARADILSEDDPIMRVIDTHEQECSVGMAEDLISVLLEKNDDPESLAKLTALVHRDLAIRSRAVSEFGLSLEAELFFFGRPLFKVLSARGFQLMK
jgi:Fe-S-cluster containining protein